MAIMDFVGILSQTVWTSMFLAKSKFLESLLTKYSQEGDTYGFITNNLITLGAFAYSQNPEIFDALKNKDYVSFLKRYVNSKSTKDQETACSCLHYIFQRKESLTEFFAHNLDYIQTWLTFARTTDGELKKTFLVSLKEFLKPPKEEEDKEKCNEIVRRAFSNLTTPQKFPDLCNEHQAVEYLVKTSDVPFEDLELAGLSVIKQLINWEWGMRTFFGNALAVQYILNRGGSQKVKNVLEIKYRIV
jgi:hypothetical protein